MKLGPHLRKLREQKGITLKEMEERSGIKRSVIQILETGHFQDLPNKTHTKYLIRRYADALKIEGEALIERYSEEIPSTKPTYKERQGNKKDKNLQYLKKTIITFVIIIGILFVSWFILLQIGSEGDFFEKKPIYYNDEMKSDSPDNQNKTEIAFEDMEDTTALYHVKTSETIDLTFKGEGTVVNMADDLDNTYVNETVTDDTFEIDNDTKQIFIAVEDNSKINISINGQTLDEEAVKGAGTSFYQFNIERE